MSTGRSITIQDHHIKNLKRCAAEAGDAESCALLLGRGCNVTDVWFSENADPEPERRFSIPAEWLISAYRAAEKRGLEVIGIFHSHPSSGAAPSETDIKFMATNPIVWLIYSVPDDKFYAHIIGDTGRVQDVVINASTQ